VEETGLVVYQHLNGYTTEFHLSGRWLSGSPIIRFGLALRGNSSRIQQN